MAAGSQGLYAASTAGPRILEGDSMKTATVVGLILVVLGVIALAYQGITYTTHKKVLDVGPIQATKTEHNTIPLSPVLGGIALVGGVVLILAGMKQA
jgi:hypothetical protein